MIITILGVIVGLIVIIIAERKTNPLIIVMGFFIVVGGYYAANRFGDIYRDYIVHEADESPEKQEIEFLDKGKVRINGKEYEYEVRYDRTAETPYATFLNVQGSNICKWLFITNTEDFVYIYTNEISIFDMDD